MDKRRFLTIFVIVFVDLLGFSLVLPLLPFYAETFGASAAVVGLLVASYAMAQFFGAPFLGRLSDRIGRRPILLLSIFGTFVGFVMLGVANTLAMLFASRILDGFTGGNISVAQAYISDITDEKNRAKGLGIIGAAFGLGFIIGPAVGGFLSQWGYAVPAFAAAGLALVNLIAVTLWLPESLTPARRAAMSAQVARAFNIGALWQALRRPRVGPLLHIRFFFGLAFAVLQTIFPLYAQYRFGLNAQTTGYILAYVGVLSVFTQGFAVARLSARFEDRPLIFWSLVVMTLALVGWAWAPTVPLLLLVMIPTAFSGGVLNTVLNSSLTKSVYPEEIGGTLGLATSVESVTRVIAPIAGGVLIAQVGTWAPGIFGALIMLWVVSFAWRRLIVRPDPPLPARAVVGIPDVSPAAVPYADVSAGAR